MSKQKLKVLEVKMKIAQLCPIFCDPTVYTIHRILQARILGWVKVKVKSLSPVPLFATPWTVAYQAPSSMGFSRQEYWSGLPFPSPGHLPDSGIELRSPALQADNLNSEPPAFPFFRGSSKLRDQTQVSLIAGRFFTSWATGEDQEYLNG